MGGALAFARRLPAAVRRRIQSPLQTVDAAFSEKTRNAVQWPDSVVWRNIMAGRVFEATPPEPAPKVMLIGLRAGVGKRVNSRPL